MHDKLENQHNPMRIKEGNKYIDHKMVNVSVV